MFVVEEVSNDVKKSTLTTLDFFEARKLCIMLFLAVVMVAGGMVMICLGTYHISIPEVYSIIATHLFSSDNVDSLNKLKNTIVWNIRFPRVIMAITVGIGLSVAGAIYQGCFRNPLVEPYILGVSSGAAFGAALGIVYPHIFISIQLGAFIFASLSVFLAYTLARSRGQTPVVTLVLAGIIIGSIFSACVSIMKYLSNDTQLREIVFWMMGGFYYTTWDDVYLTVPVVLISVAIMWFFGWKLNVLSMGDEEARALGVNPEVFKFIFIVLATLVTAICVSSVGIIAWVGLMMPHAARLIQGPDNSFVIPTAALMGGVYIIFCDTIARTLTSAEIPIGIITAIVGAPYLVYLLRSKEKEIFG